MTRDLRHLVEGLLLRAGDAAAYRQSVRRRADVSRDDRRLLAALRATLAQKIAINAFILLVASLFIGAYVLDFFGFSVPVVQVARRPRRVRQRVGPAARGEPDASRARHTPSAVGDRAAARSTR